MLLQTCALELGMDIGDLNCTLHLGFPGTFSSYWQQVGRAGRSGDASLSIMICYESPLEQYLCRNPSILFETLPEAVTISVQNVFILRSHLLCAAKEKHLKVLKAMYDATCLDLLI